MNESDKFSLLDRAAKVMTKPPELELQMLRAFFDAWEALHAIPNCQGNRKKSEQAAGVLVEAAHAIRTIRAPDQVERIANGH